MTRTRPRTPRLGSASRSPCTPRTGATAVRSCSRGLERLRALRLRGVSTERSIAPIERGRLTDFREVSLSRRRERRGTGARAPLTRSDGAIAPSGVCERMSRRRDDAISTNDDACAEIQPFDAKANYEVCYAGDAPGASASSSKILEGMVTQHSSVFCNGSASLFYKCCLKQRSAPKHSNLLVRVATSFVDDEIQLNYIKILAARKSVPSN